MNAVFSIARSAVSLIAERRVQRGASPRAYYTCVCMALAAIAAYFRFFRSGRSFGFKRTITDLGLLVAGKEQTYCFLSKESASEVFWKLGDRFWMQIIDGKYHQWGPRVFDEGLHKDTKEPGFFASLKDGCDFAAEHLTEAPSIEFYKSLHKKLCSHFKGKETKTVMSAEETGQFRTKACQCRVSIVDKEFNAEAAQHDKTVKSYKAYKDLVKNNKTLSEESIKKYEEVSKLYPSSKKWLENWELQWEKKIKETNLYIEQICQELGIKKIAKVYKVNDRIYADYLCDNPDELESIAQLLFERYQQQIKKINSSPQDDQTLRQKVDVIADLYQLLEWLHPFPDGQGRTDLVMMAKHLSEHVSNPAILIEPYSSTFSTLAVWKEELFKGMQLWKAEAVQQVSSV